MSEFSESMHLRSPEPSDAVRILCAAKVAGFVFPTQNGWVPFVYSRGRADRALENRERIVKANTGLLLVYDYAADHGCWVSVHQGARRIARLKASFEEQNASFDRESFVRLGLLGESAAENVARWVSHAHDPRSRRNEDKSNYVVAERLGLPRYAWFAYDYEQLDESSDEEPRIEVDASGRVTQTLPIAPASDREIEELIRTLPPTKKPSKRQA